MRQQRLQGENRINRSPECRQTRKGRYLLIKSLERGEHCEDVACAMGISVRTVYKWRRRYREVGLGGLQNRSSRPLKSPARTEDAVEAQVTVLRRQKRIYDLITEKTGLSLATVGRVPARHASSADGT